MRILTCAGGTGGGVYPALAVLKTMKDNITDLLWVGGEGGMEADLVKRQGIPFTTIPAAGVHGVGLGTLPRNLVQLGRGVFASRRILQQFRPDVLFFTGGYVAVPMALAGWRIPSLLYAPDIEPGLAIKSVSRFADQIAVTSKAAQKYYPANARTCVTGYPVRPDLASWDRKSGRRSLGLSEDLPVVLVFGGSKGARSINLALLDNLPAFLEIAQVIHISGELDWHKVETTRKSLVQNLAHRYHAYTYLHEEMGAALAGADLVISRAGASTLGEFPLFGLPAVLVPYPYAWRYQKVNADYLAHHGAAVILEDSRLREELLFTIKTLLANPTKLETMRSAMRDLAHPQAATAIAKQLLTLARKR